MNTPICDFVRRYAEGNPLRLHMPGHKGASLLGCEPWDITEVTGADALYQAAGIIAESEQNASELFGVPTFYSTEGSSQCIRAMVLLVRRYAQENRRPPLIWAARNVHKTFLSAVALSDLQVEWLYGREEGYLSCKISPEDLEDSLQSANTLPAAVYLTSPDYLGNVADVQKLAEICHRYGVLLAVDNAHGAYLRFLPTPCHPMDLGADLSCSSAHKTLPVLTGGAYLHLSADHPSLVKQAKGALDLFGSTSPSYLILQSLDRANALLEKEFPKALNDFLPAAEQLRQSLTAQGFSLVGEEPLKLTLATKSYGYLGTQVGEILENQGIVCEFADPDYVVFMFSPQEKGATERLWAALSAIPKKTPLSQRPPAFVPAQRVLPIREALLAPQETLPVEGCVDRIAATPSVGCPPAVPILLCGERFTEAHLELFRYYKVEICNVVLE